MKLKTTRQTYDFRDDSGYCFTVDACYDEEFGSWSASVQMSTNGFITSEDAVQNLQLAATEFLRQLGAKPDDGGSNG